MWSSKHHSTSYSYWSVLQAHEALGKSFKTPSNVKQKYQSYSVPHSGCYHILNKLDICLLASWQHRLWFFDWKKNWWRSLTGTASSGEHCQANFSFESDWLENVINLLRTLRSPTFIKQLITCNDRSFNHLLRYIKSHKWQVITLCSIYLWKYNIKINQHSLIVP